jgi:cytosine/adenosine deaminase-related metal-dependent hydrolase
MKRFSAQYVFTNAGLPLKRAIITTNDYGTVTGIEDTMGNLSEKESTEFHNGIIVPGFVNCHCQLELSNMKGLISPGGGLSSFLKVLQAKRESYSENILSYIHKADSELYNEGVVLCADICNSRSTFDIKKKSRIRYINLLELYGINPDKADQVLTRTQHLKRIADDYGLTSWIVPRSVYSLSLSLFHLLRTVTASNKITSVHFLESEHEKRVLRSHNGPVPESFIESGPENKKPEIASDHAAVVKEITPSGNLILVHNTYADRSTIRSVDKRGNTFWCLCPNANLYIENRIPPLDLLLEEKCRIVTGTDSLAANNRLSILEELKILQEYFPSVPLKDLILMATRNGAEALGEETDFGSIQPGKKPGLILIRDVDLQNMKLLPESRVTRLI